MSQSLREELKVCIKTTLKKTCDIKHVPMAGDYITGYLEPTVNSLADAIIEKIAKEIKEKYIGSCDCSRCNELMELFKERMEIVECCDNCKRPFESFEVAGGDTGWGYVFYDPKPEREKGKLYWCVSCIEKEAENGKN